MFAAVAAAAVSSFTPFTRSASAATGCAANDTMYVVAHEDDSIFFQNPDLQRDISSGRCVQTIYLTAGDAGSGFSYWGAREDGVKAAYAQMAGLANNWTQSDAGISGHPIPVFTLQGRPTISVVFLRLPDGNLDGSGFSNYNRQSLQKLWQGSIQSISAVNGSSSYTLSGLTNVLTQLMTNYGPDEVATQDFVGPFDDGDHSDHHAAAYLTKSAGQAYVTPHTLVGYQDYGISARPANLSQADSSAKQATYFTYAPYDVLVCQTVAQCQQGSGDYAKWWQRQYVVGVIQQPGSASQPTIALIPSESTGAPGDTVHASASISGVLPGAGGTVTYTVYSDSNCTNSFAGAGTKTVASGVVPDSNAVQFNTAGTYYWQAVYSGDTQNAGATSLCQAGRVVIGLQSPTLSANLSETSGTTGDTVHASATLSGAGSGAGGTVTYTVYSDSGCTSSFAGAGTKTVTNGVVPDSNAIQFNTAGTYYWQAVYSGDSGNSPATSACQSGQLQIAAPSSNIAPQATVTASSENPADGQTAVKAVDGVIDGYPGDYTREWATNGQGVGAWINLAWSSPKTLTSVSVYDRPNLNDQITGGTLSFSDGSTLPVGTLPNNGAVLTLNFAPRAVTSVRLTVTSVSATTENVGLAEFQALVPTAPAITASLSETAGVPGDTVHVSAGLAGVTASAGGTVAYTVYSDSACTTSFADGGTKPVTNGVVPDSNAIQFNTAATYYWQAAYSGDAQNASATSPCLSGRLVIGQQSPTLSLNLSETSGATGDTVHASASLSGASGGAGGTVTYTVYSDSGCTSSFAGAGTKTVTAGVVPDSNGVQFNTAGTYYWQAAYSGDAGNSAAVSACQRGQLQIAVPSANVAPQATVTASSENPADGQTAVKAVDGVIDGYPGDYTREWATNGQGVGAWINLAWSTPKTLSSISVYDRPNLDDQITGGTLSFSDGSTLPVGTLPNNGAVLTLNFAPRAVTSVRLTVTSVSATTSNVGLAEIQAFADNGLTLTTTTLHDATRGAAYSDTVAASGGTTPYSFSLTSGSLPAGLALDPVSGAISGTPTDAAGTYSFTAKVTDSASHTASQALQIVLTEALQITTASLPNGQTGQPYSQSVTAAGGSPPYAWSVSAGALPPGLSLTQGSPTATLSGTPTTGGSYSFTLRAVDGGNPARSATQSYSLNVSSSLGLTTTTLRDGTRGATYSDSLAASGGTAPYNFAIASGSLPAGLSLDQASGAIAGTPTDAAGTYSFTAKVTDAAAQTATRALQIVLAEPLQITTATLPGGQTGAAYSQTATASGGAGSYSWSVSAGALPPGVTLASGTPSATVSGTPTTAGTYSFTLRAADSGNPVRTATQVYSVTVTQLSITTTALGDATRGVAYSAGLVASGGTTPYGFSVSSGSLPAGLSLAASGAITGTPTAAAGTYSFTARVADGASQTATRALSIRLDEPLTVVTTSLPAGEIGRSYSQNVTAGGGRTPYTWSVSSGSLPPGVSFSQPTAAARLAGTPTSAGTYTFTLRVVDSGSPTRSASQTFTITVAQALSITTSTLPAGKVGTAYAATVTVSGGVSPYQWALQNGGFPTGLGFDSSTVTLATVRITGTPTATGNYSFTLRVADALGATTNKKFTVTVS